MFSRSEIIDTLLRTHFIFPANSRGVTPFSLCLELGCEDFAMKLVIAGQDISLYPSFAGGDSAMHFLAKRCTELSASILFAVVDRGADPNAENAQFVHRDSLSLFFLSFFSFFALSLSLSLSLLRMYRGETPLEIAVRYGNLPVVQALLDCDADITQKAVDIAIQTSQSGMLTAMIPDDAPEIIASFGKRPESRQ